MSSTLRGQKWSKEHMGHRQRGSWESWPGLAVMRPESHAKEEVLYPGRF